MRIMKRLLMGIGATALVALLLTVITQKTAHALVAALVEVANTSTNPVPNADVNAPGEEPLQTLLCSATGDLLCPSSIGSSSFVVPSTTSDGLSVKRLVIENVSVGCSSTGATRLQALLTTVMNENQVNGAVFESNIFIPLVASFPSGTSEPIGSLPVRAYADPGTTVSVNTFGFTTSTTGAACIFSVAGRYITH